MQNKYYICTNETIINRIKIKIMKKILAIMCAAALFVACDSKEEKIEKRAESFIEAAIAALEDGDYETFEEIGESVEDWVETLNKEEEKIVEKVLKRNMRRLEKAVEKYEREYGDDYDDYDDYEDYDW